LIKNSSKVQKRFDILYTVNRKGLRSFLRGWGLSRNEWISIFLDRWKKNK